MTPAPPAPLLLRGVGVDVCQVARLARAHARFGERLLRRAFHPAEAARFAALLARAPPASAHAFLASRWAAKEALHKALGAHRLLFPDVEVVRGEAPPAGIAGVAAAAAAADDDDPPRVPLAAVPAQLGAALSLPLAAAQGAPHFRFHGAAAAHMAAHGFGAPLLSLSHDGEYAVAFVVLQ